MLLVAPLLVAAVMHAYNVFKCRAVIQATGGVLRTRRDLAPLREAVNASMMLAIAYIALFVLLIVMLAVRVLAGGAFTEAAGVLFWFGVITLPLGLWGKKHEKKIQNLAVESTDPEVEATYRRWLAQWKEPRLRLPD